MFLLAEVTAPPFYIYVAFCDELEKTSASGTRVFLLAEVTAPPFYIYVAFCDELVRKVVFLRHREYMYERFNNYTALRPRLRKIAGWSLVVFGFFALVTPLTPGGLLFFVGLEILGLRIIFVEKVKRLFSPRTQEVSAGE